MDNKKYLISELIFLFVLMPFVLLLNIPVIVKVGVILLGVIYMVYTLIRNKLMSKKMLFTLPANSHWKYILLRFVVLVIVTTLLMYFFNAEKLFIVVKKNLGFWLMLSAFYSIFSVYPQELIYRSFFFARYSKLIKNRYLFITVNALVFSLAHLGFKNPLVLLITLIGGVVFAITYSKTKSLMFTSIEHSLYGAWLFTVGAGEMLAFPMPT